MARGAFLLALGLLACGNDDLASGAGDGGTPGDAAVPGNLPDYATSPCWGNTASTTVYSGDTHQLGEVGVTCRGETDRALLYVADALWPAPLAQAQVNSWLHRFELFTPAGSVDPSRGVLPNDEAVFGALDVAALPQGKLEIYVVDTGGAGEGYLCSWCDHPALHLDGNLLQPFDSDVSLAIAAHETVHVIHHALDPDEVAWVDESLGQAGMTVNGFFTDLQWLESFRRNPNIDWGPGSEGDPLAFHYGAGLLWGSFLWERGGADLLGAITREPANGWDGLDAALAATGSALTAWQLYRDYLVAAYLDRPELGYGFASFDYDPLPATGSLAPGGSATGTLQPYGLVYYTLDATGPVTLNARGGVATAELVAVAVIASDTTVAVTDVTSSATIDVPAGARAFVGLTGRAATSYAVVAR